MDKMETKTVKNKAADSILSNKKKRKIFYALMVSLPLLHLLIFYFYVNIRSFTMAFTKPDFANNSYVWAGLENFREFFDSFKEEQYGLMFVNSLKLSGMMTIFGLGLAVIFSYYIYKKNFLSKTFKVVLYLPHIISSMVILFIFQYFVDIAIPELWLQITGKQMNGLLASEDTTFGTIIFFSVWLSFGTQVLLFSGAMSSISDSVIESAALDGASPARELVSIVIPNIYPTFVTFLLLRIVAVFTDQMQLYTLYGVHADRNLYTLGYFLYRNVLALGESSYPYLSAVGLMMTLIAVPVTLGSKYLLTKFGPKTV